MGLWTRVRLPPIPSLDSLDFVQTILYGKEVIPANSEAYLDET